MKKHPAKALKPPKEIKMPKEAVLKAHHEKLPKALTLKDLPPITAKAVKQRIAKKHKGA